MAGPEGKSITILAQSTVNGGFIVMGQSTINERSSSAMFGYWRVSTKQQRNKETAETASRNQHLEGSTAPGVAYFG